MKRSNVAIMDLKKPPPVRVPHRFFLKGPAVPTSFLMIKDSPSPEFSFLRDLAAPPGSGVFLLPSACPPPVDRVC